MSKLKQSILVPIVDRRAIAVVAYAELLSKAYKKPISLLFFQEDLYQESSLQHSKFLATDPLGLAVNRLALELDAVFVLWPILRKRSYIQKCLNASRQWRIPYFFIPIDLPACEMSTVILPVSFLIEDREKGVWAKSLYRSFKPKIVIAQPNDKGTRAIKNIEHICAFLEKNAIPSTRIKGRKSSFKLDRELVSKSINPSDLLLATASRAYGLDDHLLGPRELRFILKTSIPIMMLNPRDDLYILCGD